MYSAKFICVFSEDNLELLLVYIASGKIHSLQLTKTGREDRHLFRPLYSLVLLQKFFVFMIGFAETAEDVETLYCCRIVNE